MKTMKWGFTLVELLVGLVVGAVLVLIVGVISQVSVGSHERLRREAEVYNDLFYGFNLIKHSVRNGLIVSADGANNTLTADNFIFRASPGNSSNLIYTKISDNSNYTIISGVTGLNFDVDGSNDPLIVLNLSGQKDRVNFNLTTEVMGRN